MNRYLQYITRQYWFRVVLTVLVCTVTVRFGILQSYTWFGVCICLLILCILWQIRLYRTHVKQVLFMIDALENNDNSFHFPEVLRKAGRSIRHSTGWDTFYTM
jgi:dolichol kinase